MNKLKDKLLFVLQFLLYVLVKFWKLWVMLALILGTAYLLRGCRDTKLAGGSNSLSIQHKKNIDITPEEVRDIRRLGQFETLAVETEELVELHRAGILRDQQIARIYVGTLRLGTDLEKAREDWFTVSGDTARLTVPRIGLLSEEFIDDTHTRPFYESGQWTAEDKETLYEQAREKMRDRCLTPQTLEEARRNCSAQLSGICFALGFRFVIVNYE